MFITIEGCEGAGKTSAVKNIRNFFSEKGREILLTREPGGTGLGASLRALLLCPDNTDIPPYSELFLYLADRAYHVHTVILPALKEGKVVICDRYIDSTLAYQGYARGLSCEKIKELNILATEGLMPTYTFLLDVDPVVGLERTRKRSLEDATSRLEERYENEDISFHIALQKAYLEIAIQEKDRFILIDANVSKQDVEEQIRKSLEKII